MNCSSFLLLSPESKKYCSEIRQVFWLTFFLMPSHSSVNKQWLVVQKAFIKAYSCGYSSGISPDSLFITHPSFRMRNTENRGKDRESDLDITMGC
jgi:hypothetical protein